jgi:hypothetical protein
MIRTNPLLKVYVAEKAAANPVVTAHRHPHSPSRGITMRKFDNRFSALAGGGDTSTRCAHGARFRQVSDFIEPRVPGFRRAIDDDAAAKLVCNFSNPAPHPIATALGAAINSERLERMESRHHHISSRDLNSPTACPLFFNEIRIPKTAADFLTVLKRSRRLPRSFP